MFISQITSLAASLSLDQHGVRRIRAVCLHALNMLTILEPLNDLRSPRRHKNHIQKFKFEKKKKQQKQFFAFFFKQYRKNNGMAHHGRVTESIKKDTKHEQIKVKIHELKERRGFGLQ